METKYQWSKASQIEMSIEWQKKPKNRKKNTKLGRKYQILSLVDVAWAYFKISLLTIEYRVFYFIFAFFKFFLFII